MTPTIYDYEKDNTMDSKKIFRCQGLVGAGETNRRRNNQVTHQGFRAMVDICHYVFVKNHVIPTEKNES